MNSKEALKLAIIEYEKDLEFDENNQWVKNVLNGLKECQQDLDQLEKHRKIEEEIGIDLEILYKVLKSESIWIQKHIGAGKFRIVEVNIRGLNINKYTNEITIRDENNSLHILNGYGKMWALTREELEEAI